MSEQTEAQKAAQTEPRAPRTGPARDGDGVGDGVLIVGAGMAGVQTAVALREQGYAGPVTLLGAEPHQPYDRPPLSKAILLGKAEDSAFDVDFEGLGIELRLGTEVTGLRPADHEVDTEAGPVPYGTLVLATGAEPLTLPGSGVALGPDGSVTADAHLRTTVPGVYAVGDCASFPSARYGTRLLVHHWDNALQGPRTVAANILAEGPAQAYDPVPYFWSEQFGRFVQYAGHHGGADTLLWRGDPAGATWSVCWLREGALVAVLAVGRPRDLAQGRKLIEAGTPVDPARVADPAVPLKSATL